MFHQRIESGTREGSNVAWVTGELDSVTQGLEVSEAGGLNGLTVARLTVPSPRVPFVETQGPYPVSQ